MRLAKIAAVVLTAAACLPALAANDRFWKRSPDSMNGFMTVKDPLYSKECGACHTAYLPGLLPARSWELHMQRLDRHFGENVTLKPELHAAILRYLVDHAADRSRYEGSLTMMERIDPKRTPYRFMDVPLYRENHRVVLEVIHRKPRIRVRRLTNCNACHQMADEGSFGNDELLIPGLTPSTRAR
jgi:hypothetical protein